MAQTKRKQLAIKKLTITALDLLDERLTEWERKRAYEIYALCSELEDGETTTSTFDGE